MGLVGRCRRVVPLLVGMALLGACTEGQASVADLPLPPSATATASTAAVPVAPDPSATAPVTPASPAPVAAVSPTPAPPPSPAPPPAPALIADGLDGLTRGAGGEPVERLQQRLTDLGYRTGGVDGSFGGMTAVAVRVFQHDHDLPASGTVDAAMIEALQTAAPAQVLERGSSGDAVLALQQQLNDGPYDAGTPDGQYGGQTMQAVYALQKLHGYPAEGSYGPIERYFLETGDGLRPRLAPDRTSGKVVEVSVPAQLVTVYDNGQLILATHTSTASGEEFCTPAGGCRTAVTPDGDYTITRRIEGWRVAELGRLYNPLYFNGGIALHGSESVPTHPASHGCVRLPMHIAEYAPDLLPNGTPVIVR